MKKRLLRPVSMLLTIILILSSFTIVPVTTVGAATTTDVLTAADFSATGTSYTGFTGVAKSDGNNIKSAAVYAGNSAKNSAGAIQLRSNNSNSGIVSTASGGTVKSVKISVASGSNTIDVYGSNTAYTAAANLYSSSSQGTKLGSRSATGTITVTGDYKYVGIRSAGGAVYLSSVEIEWENGSSSGNSYTITWCDDDNSVIDTTTCGEGEVPSHDDPQKPDDDNYRYTFSGWTPTLVAADSDATYTATYTSEPLYTVDWVDWDNAPLASKKYVAGESPVYPYGDPERTEDQNYRYTFSGWSPEITPVTGNITYKAQYTEKHKYTVTWNNWDGSELDSDIYLEGETPSYSGSTPVKSYDGESLYTFSGWSPAITAVSGDATYTAQFTPFSVSVDGFFLRTNDPSKDFDLNGKWYQYNDNEPAQFEEIGPFDESGTPIMLCGKNVADIDPPDGNATFAHSVYVTGDGTEADPYVFTANYIYKKNSGSVSNGASVSIDGSTTSSVKTIANPGDGFQAYARMKITNKQVMFLQHLDDGTITAGSYLGVGNNGTYGTSYSGAAASPYTFIDGNDTLYYIGKQDDVYLFSEQLPLNEDFGGGTSVPTYKVTWNNYDDTELTHEFYIEGETPSYKGSDPVKPTDDDYTYTFSGWSPAISTVTEAITYTAQFTPNPRQKYTITWKNYDGSVLDTEEYLEHATPSYKGADPTKADDANYYYDFSGWSPTIEKVTGNAEYTAQFTPVPKYTIIWKNWDDTVLDTEYYREGAQNPTYKHENPTRTADQEYTYSFSGWEPEVAAVVTKNETYVAQYVRTPLINPDIPVLGGTGVLPTDNNKSYEVAGKWYLDKNGNPQTFTQNGAFEENGSTLYLGNAKVSIIDTEKTLAHTVYITGAGTQDDPYIFYTNYLYGNANASNINGNGTTFTMNGVHPGDGFYGCARVNVGTGTKVTFMADPTTCQETNAGYIGVGKSNYGYHYSGSDAATYKGHGPYTFETGKHTLYYLGTNESDALVFTIQPLSAHPDFVAQFTVRWYNGSELLAQEQYASGATPEYKGATPTKAEDENFTYSFDGWDPHLMPVTRDIIYTAKFKEYPKHPSDPIEDIAWIYPTNGVLQYDLEHMYYLYDDQKHLFPGKGFVEEDGDGHITACGVIVADIVEYNDADTISEFVHTVYVSGTGSYYDPFVFHPNYEYHGPKSIISNGASLAVGEENIFATSTTIVTYPGDRYKGNTRLRVGDTPVKFLPDEEYHQADDRFLGVGETTYGYSYDKAIAFPYTFNSANDTLYYHGQDDYGFVFAEEPAQYQQSFGDPTTYTVSWVNYDGEPLETDTCYYDDIPSYDGDTPEKPGYSRFTFTFSGWTDEDENAYAQEDELPAVIGDITYTADYTKTSKLFVLHSLTLNGDIGVNFYLDVTPEEIATGSGVVVDFSWNVEGTVNKSSYKLDPDEFTTKDGKTYYKATCWVAAAEMTYDIHATATINGALEDETDDYNVREYANTIINAPEGTFDKQDDLVTLVKSMLDYGSKAQIRFNRKTDDLANGGTDFFSGEVTITSKASDMEEYLEDCGLEYYGSSIIYLTETTLRHYYRIVDSSKFTSEVKNGITFDGEHVTYGTKSGVIYFDKKNIAASELDTEYVLRINGHDYQYSALDYSALSYSLDEAPYDQSIAKQLAASFYRYNEAANVYFDN